MTEPIEIDARWRPREILLHGERVTVFDIEIPDEAPPEVREGLGRRAIVNALGTCPCGARLQLPNRAMRRRAARRGQDIEGVVPHKADCPAWLRGWLLSDLGPWSE